MVSREEGRGKEEGKRRAWDAGGGAVLLYRCLSLRSAKTPAAHTHTLSLTEAIIFRHPHLSAPSCNILASSHACIHTEATELCDSVQRNFAICESVSTGHKKQDPLTSVYQVPPTSFSCLKQGIRLHSECIANTSATCNRAFREAMQDRRSRPRSVPVKKKNEGNFGN